LAERRHSERLHHYRSARHGGERGKGVEVGMSLGWKELTHRQKMAVFQLVVLALLVLGVGI